MIILPIMMMTVTKVTTVVVTYRLIKKNFLDYSFVKQIEHAAGNPPMMQVF